LGLNAKERVLLALTLLVSIITLGTGRTSVLQSIGLLMREGQACPTDQVRSVNLLSWWLYN
jgi:hypothetical protein